jgi:Tfp pilus assembly protein FimV
MTNQEIVDFKLGLAKAWLDNGQENMARDIIRTIIEGSENKGE